jgi:hypothetical protein
VIYNLFRENANIYLSTDEKGGAMIKRQFKSVALLCCFLIGLSACSRKWAVLGGAAAAVGVGTYAYIKGDLKRNYEVPVDKAWEATVESLEELKLTTVSKQHDAFGGVIKGKMADGKGFEINLKRLGETSTEIGIRIGTFGDRQKSEAIHDKILSKI